MGLLGWLFGFGPDDYQDNVVLLIKTVDMNNRHDERRITVARKEIGKLCDDAVAELGNREVWVYQQIFNWKHPDDDEAAAALAMSMRVMK